MLHIGFMTVKEDRLKVRLSNRAFCAFAQNIRKGMRIIMQEKKGFDYGEHVEIFPDISNTVSANECTGLMPTPPQDTNELESYKELFSMEIPKRAPSKREIKNGVYDDKPLEIQAENKQGGNPPYAL